MIKLSACIIMLFNIKHIRTLSNSQRNKTPIVQTSIKISIIWLYYLNNSVSLLTILIKEWSTSILHTPEILARFHHSLKIKDNFLLHATNLCNKMHFNYQYTNIKIALTSLSFDFDRCIIFIVKQKNIILLLQNINYVQYSNCFVSPYNFFSIFYAEAKVLQQTKGWFTLLSDHP